MMPMMFEASPDPPSQQLTGSDRFRPMWICVFCNCSISSVLQCPIWGWINHVPHGCTLRLLCSTDHLDSVKSRVVSLRLADEHPYQLPCMDPFCFQEFYAAQFCCFDLCGNVVGRLALDCRFLQHHQWVEKAGANPNVSFLQPAVPSV